MFIAETWIFFLWGAKKALIFFLWGANKACVSFVQCVTFQLGRWKICAGQITHAIYGNFSAPKAQDATGGKRGGARDLPALSSLESWGDYIFLWHFCCGELLDIEFLWHFCWAFKMLQLGICAFLTSLYSIARLTSRLMNVIRAFLLVNVTSFVIRHVFE